MQRATSPTQSGALLSVGPPVKSHGHPSGLDYVMGVPNRPATDIKVFFYAMALVHASKERHQTSDWADIWCIVRIWWWLGQWK